MQIQLKDITYRYGNSSSFSLALSTHILTNQVTTLIGANGSGKSTTIKILTGQSIDFQGTYLLDETPIKNRYGDFLHNYQIGYSPEEVVLDDELTASDICLLLKEIRTIGESDFQSQLAYYKKMLNIDEWFTDKTCGEYSMGMRKKTALLIAFLGHPRFLILDEPTNGLDPIAVFGLKQMILEKRKAGVGTLLSSHILDFVEKLADHVLIIKGGRLSFDGSLGKLHEEWPGISLDEIYFNLYNGEREKLHNVTG